MKNNIDRFSDRASSYRFRWDYAADAIQAVFRESGLKRNSVVADIGSGTGALARHFAGRVGTLFAVEPNPAMRTVAEREAQALFQVVDGSSDATTLPDRCLDMITVGRAIHWFPPESTRAEFYRILKPAGWLAIFRVICTDKRLMDSIERMRMAENGWDMATIEMRESAPPAEFYFGHAELRKRSFPQMVRETWDDFVGRLSSLSVAPGVNHLLRPQFEAALREVFERHAINGVLPVYNATEVIFGQVRTVPP